MEKNVSKTWKRRTAVLAVTAALGGSALMGAVAPMTAWADAGTGTVTITSAEGNKAAGYNAYRLFTAVIDDENSAASQVDWDTSVDEAAQTELIAKINDLTSNGYQTWVDDKGDPMLAQNVLEYISQKITASSHETVNNWPALTSDSFGMKLAIWIAYESDIQSVSTAVESGEAYTDTEGYYLFMTKNNSGAVATSPIWFALGGNADAVIEKATVPTVDKEVNKSEAGSAQIGDKLPFTVTATLPGNYNSYGTYAIMIEDTPTNLAINEDTVVVKSGANDITNADGVSINVNESGKLTVKINDRRRRTLRPPAQPRSLLPIPPRSPRMLSTILAAIRTASPTRIPATPA